MRIFCAWCCHEGQPGYLGEREPLDNPEPTHGVCGYHKAQVLESLHRATLATVMQDVIGDVESLTSTASGGRGHLCEPAQGTDQLHLIHRSPARVV
jgi:hypothetical protein